MADILTAPMWAPATCDQDADHPSLQADRRKMLTAKNIAAPFIALPISAAGYYLAEGILFGSFIAPDCIAYGQLDPVGRKCLDFLCARLSTG